MTVTYYKMMAFFTIFRERIKIFNIIWSQPNIEAPKVSLPMLSKMIFH